MASTITLQEFRSFHSIDRRLFARLIFNLRRDAGYSMLAIALWLWLEEMGFPNIIFKMQSLPDHVVNAVAEEAYIMIKFLESGLPASPATSVSLVATTRGLMNSTLSLQYLFERRTRALNGICKFMESVCNRAFFDILQLHGASTSRGDGGSSSSSVAAAGAVNSSVINRAPIGPSRSSMVNEQQESEMGMPEWNVELSARQEERTLFMTFSRGYPLSETEIREYLTRNYGECVESFHMEEVPPTQQALYARVIFHSPAMVSQILEGRSSVRFVINGKHVRVRRWVMQQGR